MPSRLPVLLLALSIGGACLDNPRIPCDLDRQCPSNMHCEAGRCAAGHGTGSECAQPVDLLDVPESRVAPGGWSEPIVDVPGTSEWTVVDVADQGIEPDAGDVADALNDLISQLRVPTILSFGPGTYELDSTVQMASDLIVRGAGSDRTVFAAVGVTTAFAWTGRGGPDDWDGAGAGGQPRPVEQDVAPGDRRILLESTDGLSEGDLVMVAQTLVDSSLGIGGTFRITTVDGAGITLDLPLAAGLSAVGENGELSYVARLDPVRRGGLEELALEGPDNEDIYPGLVIISLADEVYLRDVVSRRPRTAHVYLHLAHAVAITDSFFDGTRGSAPEGGGGVLLDTLSTGVLVANNVFRELSAGLQVQVGVSHAIYAYNFHVDRVRDHCHERQDPGCESPDWIMDHVENGIADGQIVADVDFNGNEPHTNLIEGNVFYAARFETSQQPNGGNNTFFRNRIVGQPDAYGWMASEAIGIDAPVSRQTIVGNLMEHDAEIMQSGGAGGQAPLIGGNVLSGAVEWGDLDQDAALPASLYRGCRPSFWPEDLPWPPFGPDVPGAAKNRIPAQIRYEEQSE